MMKKAKIYCALDTKNIQEAINLTNKIRPISVEGIEDSDIPDITVEFDTKLLNANNFQYVVNLSEILKDSGEVGEMELEIFKLTIHSLQTYEKDLILVK